LPDSPAQGNEAICADDSKQPAAGALLNAGLTQQGARSVVADGVFVHAPFSEKFGLHSRLRANVGVHLRATDGEAGC